MNRLLKAGTVFLFFVLFVTGIACSQKSISAQSFKYDTAVSGIGLQKAESVTPILGKNAWEKRFEEDDDFGYIRIECLNADASQLLRIGFFEGGSVNEAQVFQVSYKPKNYHTTGKTVKTKLPAFVSGLKIKLGMTEQEVKKAIGPNAKLNQANGTNSFKWHTTDLQSTILKNYQAIGYGIEAQFSNNKLVQYTFGFDYP